MKVKFSVAIVVFAYPLRSQHQMRPLEAMRPAKRRDSCACIDLLNYLNVTTMLVSTCGRLNRVLPKSFQSKVDQRNPRVAAIRETPTEDNCLQSNLDALSYR
jgi:hypothetical protein